MGQYNGIKSQYPDAILLFRVGDFYETFGPDAITISKALGITLTKRANGSASEIELAGFPYHSLDTYLPRLVKAGFRVAICEQLEDPKKAKKIVKRGVTELITPGVAINEKILDHKTNNYLASVYFDKHDMGVSFVDVSTGEFLVAQGSPDYIDKLLQGFKPSEVIFQRNKKNDFVEQFGDKHYTYLLEEWVYSYDFTREKLLTHFKTKSLKGYGIEALPAAIVAAGAIIHYLGTTEHVQLQHITSIGRIIQDKYVWLDRFTIRNLELVHSTDGTGTPLIKILDKTISPMGARLMKKWVVLPLQTHDSIQERLDLVEFFIENREMAEALEQHIKSIGDLERLIARVPLAKINPRQVVQIKHSLNAIKPIKILGKESKTPFLEKIADQLNPCQALCEKIEKEIVDEPPVNFSKGEVVKSGVSEKLDEYRNISSNAKEFLEEIRTREIERTGITSLKVGFNNVFGYYLEVTNRFKDIVPDTWIRKQTLTNAERYITEELKGYEQKILSAEDKIGDLEIDLFNKLVHSMMDYIRPVQLNAHLIARLDCLLSLANVAIRNEYCKPTITNEYSLDIKEGRHPVIEQQLELGEAFVPNDIYLDTETQQIIIITGPNMSGKSALLRQTALIVLMAQMGSFVPATKATIGLVDKVFTRVGASDNISSGESTFMVEMNETASIMNNLSKRSLILLDEIGRGTSTYDGISIAWSLAEYLHNNPKANPKTLFATHYHELNELSEKLERIKNFNVATKEVGDKVLFLRKLQEGGSKHSFGIHVAAMAGMPKWIVQRANEILAELEQKHIDSDGKMGEKLKQLTTDPNLQLNLFSVDNPEMQKVKKALDEIDVNTLTPIEAMIKLNELKKMLG